MTQGKLIILGAGGHGKVVAETAQASGWQVKGFLDPGLAKGQIINGLPVLGEGADLGQWLNQCAFFPAIGRADIRWREYQRVLSLGAEIPKLVHPFSWVSSNAEIGAGTVIMAGAVVQASAQIGPCTIINTKAGVDHDCQIGAGVMIAPGVSLCGGVHVGDFSFIGAGAVIVPGVKIGRNAFIGAGTIVVQDVADGAVLKSVRRGG